MSVATVEHGFLSLGQPMARHAVVEAAKVGRLGRTLLVHGPRGAGKGAFVNDLLALLLCGDGPPGARPCNTCPGCLGARARTHPDLVIGSPEVWRDERSTGESIVGVARRWLLDSAGAPIAAERRVLLVEGVDRANEQTQNALLKALEEPLPRQVFVLVADDLGRVLPTIVSRSQLLRIGPVARSELVAWLIDRERIPADQASALARLADGLPGRAIGYARQPDLVDWRRRTQAELLSLLGRGPADRFASVRDLMEQAPRTDAEAAAQPPPTDDDGAAARVPAAAQRGAALAVVDAWQGLTRDLLVAAVGRADLAPAAQLLPELEDVARRLDRAALLECHALLERVREGLLQNAAPRLALEVAMLSWPRATTPAATARSRA